MRSIVLIGFALISLTLPARAQEQALPPQWQGVWAYPDCAHVEMVHVYTARFRMTSFGQSNNLRRIGPLVEKENGAVVHLEDGTRSYDMKTTNDGILMIYYTMPGAAEGPPDPFADEKDYRLIRHARCSRLFSDSPSLNEDGLSALNALDGVDASCASAQIAESATCREAVFAAADSDDNKHLDYRELALFYRQIVFLAASYNCRFETYFPGTTSIDAPLFATEAVATADADQSRSLDLAEIEKFWSALQAREKAQGLMAIIDHLAPLLPFLPQEDVKLLPGCFTCGPP